MSNQNLVGYALLINGELNRNWVTFSGGNHPEKMASAEGMKDNYISQCRPIDLPRLEIVPLYLDRCPSHESDQSPEPGSEGDKT